MALTYEESCLAAMFRKDSRKETIKAIVSMAENLGDEDSDILSLAARTAKSLSEMSDGEFGAFDFTPDI